jgi:GNAT superfamily N-acetyltransferase
VGESVSGASGDAPFSVVPLVEQHWTDWNALYAAYAEFYQSPQTQEMRDRVWSWLHDPGHELEGLIAVDGAGRGIGLAHFRPFPRPLLASSGGFLDDLFVAPDWRGRGVGDALVQAVAAEGRRRGWILIRWITGEDNRRARGLYDRIAEKTHWVTYQMMLS